MTRIHDAVPVPDLAAGRCQAIVHRYAEAVQSSLVKSLGAAGEGRLAELVATPIVVGRNYWRPELGVARTNVRSGEAKLGAVHWIAAFLGRDVSMRLHLEPGARLLFDGTAWSAQSSTEVVIENGSLSLESTERRIDMMHTDGAWRVAGLEPAIDCAGQPAYASTMNGAGVSGTYPNPFDWRIRTLEKGECEGSRASVESMYRDAFCAIAKSTAYGKWISSTIAGAVLTLGDAEVASTDPSFPGLVVLKNASSRVEALGRLADASSQQKLFQLAMLSPPTEQGREEIHYLRSRRTYTTTRRLLASAMQHVNAIGALTALDIPDEDGSLRGVVASRRLLLESECWAALDASKSLTDQGAELWSDLKVLASDLFSYVGSASHKSHHRIEESAET